MNAYTRIKNHWEKFNEKQWRIVHIVLLILAGVTVYYNSLQVQYVMDDYRNISFLGSQNILDVLLHGGSRRVVDATFTLNHHLHGLKVEGYHLFNLTIHIASSITLYFMVISALGALRPSFSNPGNTKQETSFVERFVPLSVGLFFVVHPIQTQAVTYIIQRYTSLATFFYLLSALLFIRARIAYDQQGSPRYFLILGTASFAAAVLALECKQIAVTLPVILIFLELYLFQGRLFNRKFCGVCGLFLILALITALITWHDRSLHDIIGILHNATSEDHFTSRATYFLTQTRIIVTYWRLLFLPFGQSLLHDYRIYTNLHSLPVIASLALHISLIITAAVLFRLSGNHLFSEDKLKGVLQRLASLGIAWFYITMAVESSLFPITDKIFEHRIYLPSVGFFLTIVSIIALAVRSRKAGFKTAWTLLATISLILGGLTIARNQVWSDTLILWQDTVTKAPNNGLAVANLAGEYMNLDQPDKALPLFVRALELNQVFLTTTKVHLGMTLNRLNIDSSRFTSGTEILSPKEQTGRRTLDRKEQNQLQCIMYNNLGLAYEYLEKLLSARESYRASLLINPSYDLAWYNLGLLSIRLNEKDQVTKALLQLNKINPVLAKSLATAIPPQPP